MSEEVMGAFGISEVHVLKSNINYMLFFTPDRLVAAKARLVVPDHYPGLVDIDGKFYLDSQNVLATDKHNFEIPYSDISKVEMKTSWIGPAGPRVGKITIFTQEKKQQFDITRTFGVLRKWEQHRDWLFGWKFEDCVNIVRSVLPNKIQQ